ncbi:MAG TPA: triphosphoribosyl-dephospho-CoA synthase [Hyphomicrobium sp.]|nr:triphosphoribosyl-dephospho-CoA synthase [Hyphomicrobium sp.]
MSRVSEADTAAMFLTACRAELGALKPGNVHIHAGGHGMEVAQFEASAAAAAPYIAARDEKVGTRILRAVEASFAVAGCNTNLGILLLCAPLAAAAQREGSSSLRERLHGVLTAFDAEDTAAVYAAIRLANPGGLGSVDEEDVAAPPSVGLLQAMAMAAERDRIATAYVTDYTEIFDFGLPVLANATGATNEKHYAITTLHMAFLAFFPDSHIARKHGMETAEAVRAQAHALAPLWQPAARPDTAQELLAFDADLKRRGINPGTTADLVVATLFATYLCTALRPVGAA